MVEEKKSIGDKTINEVTFDKIQRMIFKGVKGLVVSPDLYKPLKDVADKTSETFGMEIKEKDVVNFRGTSIYCCFEFRESTFAILKTKPDCIFCSDILKEEDE